MAKKKRISPGRLKKRYPKTCYGNEHRVVHAEGCRPGRPLCRWMRKVRPQRRACGCDAYHFPHRSGSGRCGNPEKMWEFVYGPDAVHEGHEREAIESEGRLDDERPSGVYLTCAFDDYATGSDDDVPF